MAGDAARAFANSNDQLELLRQTIDDEIVVHQAAVEQLGGVAGDVEHGGRIGVAHLARHLQIGMTAAGEHAQRQQVVVLKIGVPVVEFAGVVEVQRRGVDVAQGGDDGLLLGCRLRRFGCALLGGLLLHVDDQLLRIVEADLRHIVVLVADQGHVVHPAGVGGDGQIGCQACGGRFDHDDRRLAGIGGLHQPAHAVADGQVGDVLAGQQVDNADVQRRAGDGGLALAVGIHHHAVGADHAGRAAGIQPGLRGGRGRPPVQRDRRLEVVDLMAGLQWDRCRGLDVGFGLGG